MSPTILRTLHVEACFLLRFPLLTHSLGSGSGSGGGPKYHAHQQHICESGHQQQPLPTHDPHLLQAIQLLGLL